MELLLHGEIWEHTRENMVDRIYYHLPRNGVIVSSRLEATTVGLFFTFTTLLQQTRFCVFRLSVFEGLSLRNVILPLIMPITLHERENV